MDREFFKQLMFILKIIIPSWRSKEVGIIAVHTFILVMRTLISIYVAGLEGTMVRHIVQKDVPAFGGKMLRWFAIAIPATFINSLIRYLEKQMALSFRSRLVGYSYEQYFKNETYYR